MSKAEHNALVEKIAIARLPYYITGRNSGKECRTEWFIASDILPAGEFIDGPLKTEQSAFYEMEILNAQSIISLIRDELRTPSAAMVEAGWNAISSLGGEQSSFYSDEESARFCATTTINAMLDASALTPGDGE